MTLYEMMKVFERQVIEQALKSDVKGRGRFNRVAKLLGISRKSLWEKIRLYQIDKTIAEPQEAA